MKESLGSYEIGRTLDNHYNNRQVEVFWVYDEDGRTGDGLIFEPQAPVTGGVVEPVKIVLKDWLILYLLAEIKLRKRKRWLKQFFENLLRRF